MSELLPVEVTSVIEEALQTTAPAIALTVYQRGERRHHAAYGWLDPDTRQHPTPTDALFDLASVTKLYTATVFLMLVAAGKVRLDTPVNANLPEFGTIPRPIGAMQDPHTLELTDPTPELLAHSPIDPSTVTFWHLLTHTGGLAPWRDVYQQVSGDRVPPPPDTVDPFTPSQRMTAALSLIGAYPFVDVPGREVRYSDLGLILLGAAVARLDGVETLAEALDQRVFAPLELHHTQFKPTGAALGRCVPTEDDQRWRGRRCIGEVHDENACGLGGIAGHAGVFATADDVARFGQFWLDALAGKAASLPAALAREAVTLQATTDFERRGLGWALRTPNVSSSGVHFSAGSFGHTGYTGTSLWIDPEREVVVSLMTNRVYLGRDAKAILAFRPKLHNALAKWLKF